MHKFTELTLDKSGASHKAELHIGRATISFQLDPKEGTGSASFPLSKGAPSDKIIDTAHPHKLTDTDRQNLFESLVLCLATVHPNKLVPNVFSTADGTVVKLDKTAAAWALDSGKFERAIDCDGCEALKPFWHG